MKIMKPWLMILALTAIATTSVRATLLDFRKVGNTLPNETYAVFDPVGLYGDNVASGTQAGYLYGADYGFTPNVDVTVGNVPAAFVANNNTAWGITLPQTRSVLTFHPAGVTNSMTFSLDVPGGASTVTLESFYAGTWSGNPSHGFEWLAAFVDNSLTPAWVASPAARTNFPSSGRFFAEGNSLGWAEGVLTATNNVRLEWVPNAGNNTMALANIGFSSTIPEPGTVMLIAVGGMILGWRYRRG